jgi:dTDP-glucose 4,6-dehydratase
MNKKNILVTGGYGFIGSNFINHLIDNYEEFNLINLDYYGIGAHALNVKKANTGQNITHYTWDIAHDITHGLKVDLPFDYVFHFANECHIDPTVGTPDSFIHSNVSGTLQTLELAHRIGVKRVIIVSSDRVTGSIKTGTAKEHAKYNPSTVYGASKAAAELVAKAYGISYGIDVVTTRCSNVFGVNQPSDKLIPMVIKNALAGEPITIEGDGKQRRVWTYVDNYIRDLIYIAENGKKNETYNIGHGYELSNIELVKMILNILDKKEELIQYVPTEKYIDFRYALNTDKLSRLRYEIDCKLPPVPSSGVLMGKDQYFTKKLTETIELYK